MINFDVLEIDLCGNTGSSLCLFVEIVERFLHVVFMKKMNTTGILSWKDIMKNFVIKFIR